MTSALTAALAVALSVGPPSSDECLALQHGVGRPRDLAAARRCLEAAIGTPCSGESPDLARAELAVMYLDGQGGPAEPERAWKLLHGCFEDATVKGLREHFARAGPTGAFDLCSDLGGTTFTINECGALGAWSSGEARSAAIARLRQVLPPELHDRLGAAERAWSTFAAAAAEFAGDQFRGGTVATSVGLAAARGLSLERARWADGLPALHAGDCDAKALLLEDARLNAAYRSAAGRGNEVDPVLRAAQRAWLASRDADAALMKAWKGTAHATAVSCLATRARAAALEAVLAERASR